MAVAIYNDAGQPVKGRKGELVCTRPFPSMPIGFWNDADGSKYHAAYFERFANIWCHGDGAELTEHDGLIIYGRSDTVLNPAGAHRHSGNLPPSRTFSGSDGKRSRSAVIGRAMYG